jgi:hypothetical protein
VVTSDTPDEDFVNYRTVNEGTQVRLKEVWKRKKDGLLVRVTALIFAKPKRVVWQALPNQDNPSTYGTVSEFEFKRQYEIDLPATMR